MRVRTLGSDQRTLPRVRAFEKALRVAADCSRDA